MYIYIYICTHIHTFRHTCIRMMTCMHIHAYVYIHTFVRMYMYAHTYIHTIHTYDDIYKHVFTYNTDHMHIHTYTPYPAGHPSWAKARSSRGSELSICHIYTWWCRQSLEQQVMNAITVVFSSCRICGWCCMPPKCGWFASYCVEQQ